MNKEIEKSLIASIEEFKLKDVRELVLTITSDIFLKTFEGSIGAVHSFAIRIASQYHLDISVIDKIHLLYYGDDLRPEGNIKVKFTKDEAYEDYIQQLNKPKQIE